MKTIVAGSRSITSYEKVKRAIEESNIEITEVVCGMAQGADLLGKQWADENQIPVKEMPAQWMVDGKLDRAAGHKRNYEMAKYAEALIAVWNGYSDGTASMIRFAEKRGLKVVIARV